MDVPWEGGCKCSEHEDNDFEDFVAGDIPAAIRELFSEHGDLNQIDFFSVGTTDLFTHEHFNTESNNVDSDDEELMIGENKNL